jgi:serine phosphatase RsbU (regulator of sigma subunit)
MAAQPGIGQRGSTNGSRTAEAVTPFAELATLLLAGGTLGEALAALADAAAQACGADVAVVRLADLEAGCLTARAVCATSSALAAELEGSRLALDDLPAGEALSLEDLPEPLRRAAARIGATDAVQIPLHTAGAPLGSIEIIRVGGRFGAEAAPFARLAAGQLRLAVLLLTEDAPEDGVHRSLVEVAGDALSAGFDGERTSDQVARLAAEVTGAVGCRLWLQRDGGPSTPVAAWGAVGDAGTSVDGALSAPQAVTLERPDGGAPVATLRLGEPALGVLELFYRGDEPPSGADLSRLATFGVRAAHALRASDRAQSLTAELERTRALLAVVGQAIAQLSLAHTLETAVERVAELLGIDRVAVYLREDDRLLAAAGRSLSGPHARVAERLLELALGPFRGRGLLVVDDAADDDRLAAVATSVVESGIEAAVALPLLARDEVAGLLAVYPHRGRALSANDRALLSALAAQLAVAVQNARLHEQTKRLGEELESALTSEREAARRLRALYEISRSFAQSLSLDATLDAVALTVVELLNVDAAVIRTPDARRDYLQPQAMHVADSRLAPAVRAMLLRPQPFAPALQRIFRTGEPLLLDAESAGALGGAHALLVPFLEAGSTAAIIPIATPVEVLATFSILSLDPERPIDGTTLETALAIAGQAALAIDNARLYQQQKDFADTMQRSLLPRERPQIPGIELGDVYAPSSRVEVGGDVYDFLQLEDGRLAVVLGDVTGHGIEATADMAMAKFVFRSLARVHPEPGDFLAHANDVVVDEIAPGKFITMAYLVIDPSTGECAYASAGHPPPRLVLADGTVESMTAHGLPLGIESGLEFQAVTQRIPPGSAVVLYTDGVVEARQEGELFGMDRFDELLSARRDEDGETIARAVLEACRAFGGGELTDDCAIVVVKRR